jgi:hypothetical protein
MKKYILCLFASLLFINISFGNYYIDELINAYNYNYSIMTEEQKVQAEQFILDAEYVDSVVSDMWDEIDTIYEEIYSIDTNTIDDVTNFINQITVDLLMVKAMYLSGNIYEVEVGIEEVYYDAQMFYMNLYMMP